MTIKWYKKKKNQWLLFITAVVLLITLTLPLPYEMYLPGGVSPIEDMLEIEGGYDNQGEFYSSYVTVITKPSPLVYAFSKTFQHAEAVPLTENEKSLSVDELRTVSAVSKKSSIDASLVAAYEAAGLPITAHPVGVMVTYRYVGNPIFDKIRVGDVLIGVNGHTIKTSEELVHYLGQVNSCSDTVTLRLMRDGKEKTIETTMTSDNERCKLGIGIRNHYELQDANPKFTIKDNSGYGGSAGLMQALMIYDKLTEHDMTYGLKIAGTGGIDLDGNVTLIAGIKQKVLGAIKDDIDIFFAPDLEGSEGNLYQIAIDTKKELNSDIKIIPVKTLEDAITYLNQTYGELGG
jgi:Lon-like protease